MLEVPKIQYIENSLCPACNAHDKPKWGVLIKRSGKFGTFLGCNRYPDCKFIAPRSVHNSGGKRIKVKPLTKYQRMKIREAEENYQKDLEMIRNLK